jgi:hypothetical protein
MLAEGKSAEDVARWRERKGFKTQVSLYKLMEGREACAAEVAEVGEGLGR